MRALAGLAVAGLAGCTGSPSDRTIPVFNEGVVSEGDCDPSQVDMVDAAARLPIYAAEEPLLQLDHLQGNSLVMRSEQEYLSFMGSVGFAQVPVVDFDQYVVVAAWKSIDEGCGFSIEERHYNRKTDGSFVYDVTFFDGALNCDQPCFETHRGLVVDSVAKTDRLSICYRTEPGCSP